MFNIKRFLPILASPDESSPLFSTTFLVEFLNEATFQQRRQYPRPISVLVVAVSVSEFDVISVVVAPVVTFSHSCFVISLEENN